jgi:hypothetical protein
MRIGVSQYAKMLRMWVHYAQATMDPLQIQMHWGYFKHR